MKAPKKFKHTRNPQFRSSDIVYDHFIQWLPRTKQKRVLTTMVAEVDPSMTPFFHGAASKESCDGSQPTHAMQS